MNSHKNIGSLLMMGLLGITILMLSACNKEKGEPVINDAFNNGTSERNMIVIISDMPSLLNRVLSSTRIYFNGSCY